MHCESTPIDSMHCVSTPNQCIALVYRNVYYHNVYYDNKLVSIIISLSTFTKVNNFKILNLAISYFKS